MNEFLAQITPLLVNLAVLVFTALIGILGVYINKQKTLIISKIGKTQFDKAMTLATGLWYFIQDNYPEWSADQKIKEMETKLLATFPTLTQIELESINKATHALIKNTINTTK